MSNNMSISISLTSENKLYNKNFVLMVIGQIISILGNSIIRFSLSLYALNVTGSAVVFGSVLAISMIPSIIFSPLGGILSDRVNRRDIMIVLDFLTAAIIGFFVLILKTDTAIIQITILMILLGSIQSFYSPAVQASIPLLAPLKDIIKANAIITQVNSFSNLIGPMIGGVLFALFSIKSILGVGALCFFISAIIEIFIKMPFTKSEDKGNIFKTIISDLKESLNYILVDKKIILKIMIFVATVNCFLTPLIVVGIPYIMNTTLQLDSKLVGTAQGAVGIGAILGGIVVQRFKIEAKDLYKHLLILSISILPIGLTILCNFPSYISFLIITCSGIIFMLIANIFSITMLAAIQKETPNQMLGKVMSYILTLSMVAQPIGQSAYGFLLDGFASRLYIVITFGSIIGLVTALASKRSFKKLS